MARKKEIDYFELMQNAMNCACDIGDRLSLLVEGFDQIAETAELNTKLNEIHEIEHQGDRIHRQIVYELNRAFITPIDREDILLIAHDIDKLTDNIENVAFRLWMFNITKLRPEMKSFVGLIVKSCAKAAEVLQEFQHFKKSGTVSALIQELYSYEHEGDTIYRKAVKDLFTREQNSIEIQKWRELYHDMEVCFDICKELAQSVENAIVKNS